MRGAPANLGRGHERRCRRTPACGAGGAAQMLLLDAAAVHATRRPSGETARPASAGPVTGSAVGRGSPPVSPSSPIGSHHMRVGVAGGEQHAASVRRERELRRQAWVHAHLAHRPGWRSTVHSAAPRNTPAGAATAKSTRPAPGIHCGVPSIPSGGRAWSAPPAASGHRRRPPEIVDRRRTNRRVRNRPARATGRRAAPSGDHVGCAPKSVILRAAPPRDGTTQMPLPASSA